MKLSIFCPFGWKTPIHAPKKLGFSGDFTPKMGSHVNETPKKIFISHPRSAFFSLNVKQKPALKFQNADVNGKNIHETTQ